MGLFSKYQAPPSEHEDMAPFEPEPPIDRSLGPLWPPSPKVQILLLGIGFFLLNLLLLVFFAIVLWQRG